MDNQREYRTAIVYGPPGSGKTHHAAGIARALGCAGIIDGWEPDAGANVTPGALHPAQERPAPGIHAPAHVLILSIDAALAAAFVMGAI